MAFPVREKVINLLESWQKEDFEAERVLQEAEKIFETLEITEFDKSDENSIPLECLSQLEILNHQWITQDDIPAFLKFLKTPKGAELKGWEKWETYWKNLDFEKRKKQLIGGPKIYGVNQTSKIRF